MPSCPLELVVMKVVSSKCEEEKRALDHNRLMKMKQLFLKHESMCDSMIAEARGSGENSLLCLVDFRKILVKNLNIAVFQKSRPEDPKVPTSKKDLIIAWNSDELHPNPMLEEHLNLHAGSVSTKCLSNELGGNESETNAINGNSMDVDDENDTNLEVNANLTYDSVIDNSVEMDCDAVSKKQRVVSATRTKLMHQMVVN